MKYHEPCLTPVQDVSSVFHINHKGESVYSHRFTEAFGFYQGLAVVTSQTDGQTWFGDSQEEYCFVRDKNSQYVHIDMAKEKECMPHTVLIYKRL